MNKFMVMAAMALGLLVGVGSSPAQAESVQSLRGTAALEGADDKAPDFKRWMPDRPPVPRAFVQQPPIIPHNVDEYRIDQRDNKCLTCHAWSNYREHNATKISLTHFRDRGGTEISDVSPQRYFCTQCHVPQVDAPPLVRNTFKPVDALSRR